MLGNQSMWAISAEEFAQHRVQFELLNPVKGHISGQQAKEYLIKSKLTNQTLGKIWSLADFDQDGRMSLHEFSIAMHLIKKKLGGVELPNSLPKEMLVPPDHFPFSDINSKSNAAFKSAPSYNDVMARDKADRLSVREKPSLSQDVQTDFPPLPKRASPQSEWVIMQAVRPRYRLQFNQQDRDKKGYLAGEEAKAVLTQSGLSNSILAQIWNLSDIDSDGKLTCEEFCVAMYLVEQARAGRSLPSKLPDTLIPPSMISVSNNKSLPKTPIEPEWTSNSDSRPGTLKACPSSPQVIQETPQTSSPWNKPLPSTPELEIQSQINQKLEKERQRLIGLEESRLQEAVEERNKEKELLKKIKNRQEFLIDALALEEEKCQMFQAKLKESLQSVESHKAHIELMRNERDQLVDSTFYLYEELEAAKAEHSRCQRDRNTLEQKLNQELHSSPFQDDIIQLEKLKEFHKQSINSLHQEIIDLQASIDLKSQNVVNNSNKLHNLQAAANCEQLPEIRRLRSDVQSKRNEVMELLEKQIQNNGDKNLIEDAKINGEKFPDELKLERYQAVHQFIGRQTDELTFKAGDLILVRDPSPENTPQGWLCGKLQDTNFFGLFPDMYVKKLESVHLDDLALTPDSESSNDKDNNVFDQTLPDGATIKKAPSNVWVEAVFPWIMEPDDEAPGQLTFNVGQKIRVLEETAGDWWKGEICTYADDDEKVFTTGWFPRIYVQPVDYSDEVIVPEDNTMKYSNLNFAASNDILGAPISPNTSTTNSNSSGEYCLALYPYESTVPGDLTMRPGDIIQVIDKSTHWWKGHIKGARENGMFPSHYVKKLTKQDLEHAQDISTMSSEYYTALSLEASNSPTMLYDDISRQANDIETDSIITDPDMEPSRIGENTAYSNYCTIAESSDSEDTDNLFKPFMPKVTIVRAYSAHSIDELTCIPGQEVVILDTSDDDWYKVQLSVNGENNLGWVPRYCIDKDDLPLGSDHHIDLMTASGYDRCLTLAASLQSPDRNYKPEDGMQPGDKLIAMYPYAAQNPDELSFSKNSVVQIISKDEPEWWRGRNISTSMVGLFPVNYVRLPKSHCPEDEDIIAQSYRNPSDELNNAYSNVTGRPISWYIDGVVNFNAILTEDEKRRQFYIRELIETEKAYYEDLQEVHRVFYEPIKKASLLTAEELKHIFINWTDLIPKSYNFYMALKIRKDNSGPKQPIQCVGDILLSNFPNFIVYVRFCSLQNQAITLLEKKKQAIPKFKELCQQCEENLRCKKMPMSSYFLKPMQRITKYKLIVENILKNTEDVHPDLGDMEEAVAAARSLCEAVNEGIREKENSERLEWIQDHVQCDGLNESLYFNSTTNSLGHRKLIHSGTLFKAKSGKELVGFLFNDFLLLSTPTYNTNGFPFVFPLETSSNSKMQFKMYKKPILLNRVLIMTGSPSTQNCSLSVTASTGVFGNVSHSEIFTIKEAAYDYVLKAFSVNDRDKWVERLVAASLQYIETENSVREISMSIRRSAGVGRLLVTVLEGSNLKGSTSGETKTHAYCEASLGNQLRRTKVISSTYNPKWNCHMQFLIKSIELDVLCLSAYDKDYFAPNDFLGRTEVALKDIKQAKQGNKGPIEKRLKLMGVNSGELIVKLDLAFFRNE